jgi:superfamily II DNA/RNA helicase
MEVERQMPKKYEHILSCRLSKRQRFLYEEYMSRTKTKETLAAGNYLSVINILMQLRKVCNHPDLFEPRPTLSPFRMTAIRYYTASLVLHAMQYDPFKHVCLGHLNLRLPDTEFTVEAFAAFRCSQLQAPRAYLLDPLSAHPHGVDLTGERGGLLAGGDEGELSDLVLPGLTSAQEEWGMGRHRHMHDINSLRCQRQPVYGRDLVHTILSLCRQQDRRPSQPSSSSQATANEGVWLWTGSLACERVMTGVRPEDGGSGSLALSKALLSYHTRAHVMEDTIRRFTIALPPATVPQISLHCHHPPPSHTLRETEVADAISRHLSPASSLLHTAATAASLQFPETRLIQYDCGKLQMLDSLLQQLKMGAHRVLIFTQMARMLDVLEIFLNYHGHTYLRLDGSTPPLKRQFLMDRFNRDKKIFCFILSTRSGGLGVNLTGADTVVFYDSDWNPTMDAQAQDRCHRIGQTRDVHIYRLVSERTVEENILKKANQKKLLGNIAIEGGAFTTDFFRKASLRELFKVQREEGRGRVAMETTTEEELSQKQIEEMLADVEDDTDVQAARMARAEETAEMAEFDENFNSQSTATAGAAPSKEGKTALTAGVESQVQSEFDRLQEELSGVEQYAMRYLEAERAHVTSQELRQAEENIRRAKKDWELTHLQSLRAAEERLAEEEAEDVLLTYDRPETANKVILRRRPSTGTWEILSRPPDLDLAPGDLEERGRHRGKRAGSRGSRRKRTSAVSESASSCIGSVAVASSSSLDAGAVYSADRLDNGTVNEQESPLPLVNHHDRGGSDERSMSSHDQVVDREIESHDESHDQQLKSRDLGIESHDRPDGSDVGSHDQSLTPKSNGLRGETESLTPPRLSSEEKQLNFPAPLLLGTPLKSEPPSPLLATPPRSSRNPSEVDTDSISSRTRQRQASLSLSDLNLSSSSSSSPSHKYPTRHRLSLN